MVTFLPAYTEEVLHLEDVSWPIYLLISGGLVKKKMFLASVADCIRSFFFCMTITNSTVVQPGRLCDRVTLKVLDCFEKALIMRCDERKLGFLRIALAVLCVWQNKDESVLLYY